MQYTSTHSLTATVCVFDEFGQELDAHQYSLVNLLAEHNQDTITITQSPSSSLSSSGCVGVQYVIAGVRLGGAVITFSTSKHGGRLYSEPHTIQVGVDCIV